MLVICLALTAVSGWRSMAVGDEWERVPSISGTNTENRANGVLKRSKQPRNESATRTGNADSTTTFLACGERATNPAPNVAAMVARIDALWSANVRVYESVEPETPHAMPGGCIFYNQATLAALLGQRLDLRDPHEVKPLLYAIFAHEVGHEYHRDFSAARAATPSRIKELEADRFAGYTLEELNVPANGLAPYWSLAGDEFGAGPRHGTSTQRVAAFREGWNLAKWDRPEDSQPVTAATNEPVAPEDSSGAP